MLVINSDSDSDQLIENEVPWLLEILKSYPGSKYGNAETRGLDSPFAEMTYVETRLEEALLENIKNRSVSLVILCGNAGDGKTAFLQHLATKLGRSKPTSGDRIWEYTLSDGLRIKANLDGSAAYEGKTANEILDEFFAPFHDEKPPENIVYLVAINSGKLLEWIEDYRTRDRSTFLIEQLWDALENREAQLAAHIRFIDLNVRSLVGGFSADTANISTNFLDRLLDKFLRTDDPDTWRACLNCRAKNICTVRHSVELLTGERGDLVKQKTYRALQAVHQRGKVHITARELRGAISYIFFGTDYCKDIHAKSDKEFKYYYERAFNTLSENRQGEVLEELTLLDPALENHPTIDRKLLHPNNTDLPSQRRRGYFEWTDRQIQELGLPNDALNLAKGKYLSLFLEVGNITDKNINILRDLCAGISKLEDLPPIVLSRQAVALKITPRTPTESVFWVEKSLDRFSLFPNLYKGVKGLETLHNNLILEYKYGDGRKESLILGMELFYTLMELKEGYQVSDRLSDEIFSNLSIFTQRLIQENDRLIYAWNPLDEERIYQVALEIDEGEQRIVINKERKI